MSKNIYVGNLSFNVTEDMLRQLFEKHGAVKSVRVTTDRETGKSRGFGFVEMEDADASKAIAALNGTEMDGRALTVNEARPRNERSSGPQRGQSRW